MKARTHAPAPPRRPWLRRLGHVAIALAFAGVLAGGWAYQRARAQVSESFFELGEQMMRYADARRQDTPRDLVVNGQTLRLSSGTAAKPAGEVLDHFEARCAEVDGSIDEQIAQLRADHPEVEVGDLGGSPVLREQHGRQGWVACIDMGAASLTVHDVMHRLERFEQTGDVADVGDVRFVFTEEYERDGATQTHFVAMWSQGSFDLDRMFPADGDAPGVELDDVPRPPASVRRLSGFERGQPYTMTVYASRQSEADLERHFRQGLPERGWTLLEPERPLDGDAPRIVLAERGRRMLTVVLAPELQGGATAALFHSQ